MDLFIVGLPRTNRGHDLVQINVDHLTKMAHFIPTRINVKMPKLARLFVENLYKLQSLPIDRVLDCDSKFDSHFWRTVFEQLDTALSMSTADHPESDDQTKHFNKVLEDMLRAFVSKRQSN